MRILFTAIFMQILFLLLHNERIVVVAIIFESNYMTYLHFMLLSFINLNKGFSYCFNSPPSVGSVVLRAAYIVAIP